jgi:hypothetical protein
MSATGKRFGRLFAQREADLEFTRWRRVSHPGGPWTDELAPFNAAAGALAAHHAEHYWWMLELVLMSCDSGLEREMAIALLSVAAERGIATEVLDGNGGWRTGDMRHWHGPLLRVEPQVKMAGYVLDFEVTLSHVTAYTDGPSSVTLPTVRAALECDGDYWHARTVQQAQQGRRKDRAVQRQDLRIFRFTETVIKADPFACADELLDSMMAEGCQRAGLPVHTRTDGWSRSGSSVFVEEDPWEEAPEWLFEADGVGAWRDEFQFDAAAAWAGAFFSLEDAVRWRGARFVPANAFKWLLTGLTPPEAREWCEAGFDSAAAGRHHSAGRSLHELQASGRVGGSPDRLQLVLGADETVHDPDEDYPFGSAGVPDDIPFDYIPF